MNVFLVGVIISIIIYLGVGWYVGRKVKNVDDYYVAGRNAPVILIVGSLIASFLSTGAFLGDTGEVASGAFMAIIIVGILQGSGYIYGSSFFGRYIRRSETLTVPEYFGKRFNSKRMRVLSAVTLVVAVMAYMLSATQGISTLMSSITGLSFQTCVLIAWCSYTFFTIYAGSPGVLITDTIMFLVFLAAALIAVPAVVMNTGGWMEGISNLATLETVPGILSWQGNTDYIIASGQTTAWAIVYGIVWMLVVMVSPWQTSRYMMAKNEHVVMRSAIFASMGVIIVTTALYFTAAFVTTVEPDLGSNVMIYAAMNMMPKIVGIVLLTGILAAGISSGSTFLSLCGFSLTNDIFQSKNDNPESRLKFSRNGMLIISAVVLVLAYFNPPQIFWVMYFGGTVIASSWGFVAFASIWSKKLSEAGAFYGMLFGFIGVFTVRLTSALGLISPPFFLDSFFVGIYMSIIGILIGNKMAKPSKVEIEERAKLFIIPEAEKDPVEMKKTQRVWKLYVVFGVAMGIFMVCFYALPYAQAL